MADICVKCGRCCQLKVRTLYGVFLTGKFCEHLDPQTRMCRVYDRREALYASRECSSVEDALKEGILPPDCPYALQMAGYRTVVEDWKKEGS